MGKTTIFRQGVFDALPIAASYIPIAASFGVLGIQYNISILACLAMSAFVFAGASQFVAIGLIASGADVLQVVLGTFFLNLRHLIMGVSLKNRFGAFVNPTHNLVALMITDETYSLTANNNSDNINCFIGVGLCSYFAWLIGTLIGTIFSQYIPIDIAGNFTIILYALFITLLVPSLKKSNFAMIACGVSLVLSCLFYTRLGAGWSIILATVVASAVAGSIQNKVVER